MTLGVALVGAGGVGRKRAAAVAADPATRLVVVCDRDEEAARLVASVAPADGEPARVVADWRDAVGAADVDLVIVSTTHDALAPISTGALQAGKHVLCEKPLGRNAEEAAVAVAAAEAAGRVLHAGYNHRFHPAVLATHKAVMAGQLGELMYVRGRYGHGGRPGYDREWRADAAISGGGELLDQGAHLIDLTLWFLGDVGSVNGRIQTAFWDMTPVEDNAFVLFRTLTGQTASLHVSWTQWRNLFCFEVFGRDGYAVIDGLGGSYGPERLTLGRRRREGGVPEEETQTFAGEDGSWGAEWGAFLAALEGHETMAADGVAGARTLAWVGAIYRSAGQDGAPQGLATENL